MICLIPFAIFGLIIGLAAALLACPSGGWWDLADEINYDEIPKPSDL